MDWRALATELVVVDRVLMAVVGTALVFVALRRLWRVDRVSAGLLIAAAFVQWCGVVLNQVVGPAAIEAFQADIERDLQIAVALPAIFNLQDDVVTALAVALLLGAIARLAGRLAPNGP